VTSQVIGKLHAAYTGVKKIYWVPADLDGTNAFTIQNVTAFDQNIHNKVVVVVPGLVLVGFGGSARGSGQSLFTDSSISTAVNNLYSMVNSSSSVILLTYGGPTGFSTTEDKTSQLSIDVPGILPSAYWNDTGTTTLPTILATQQNTILNVHGNNPTGVGASNYGNTRIINPGSGEYTQTLALVETVTNAEGHYILSNWKFYRFGSVTIGGNKFTTTVHDTCTITKTTVLAPYVQDVYSKVSIGFYVGFSVIVWVLSVLWLIHVGHIKAGGVNF